MLLDFKLYDKAIVIKTVYYWCKKKDKINETEYRRINPRIYGQLIYNKGGKTIQWGMGSLFNI